MGIPILQMAQIGAYVLGQKLKGRKRFPLVLMLEPLFRCNLACAGCGKIDYPDAILNQRIPLDECLAGDRRMRRAGRRDRRRRAACCTRNFRRSSKAPSRGANSSPSAPMRCCSRKYIDRFKPNRYFNWSIHLDGDEEMHDHSVCQKGVYDRAVAALKLAKSKGFRVTINCTLFNNADPERVARFFDEVSDDRHRRHHGFAGLCLRARARSAALPQSQQDEAIVPRHLQARPGRQGVALLPVHALPRFSRRQPNL